MTKKGKRFILLALYSIPCFLWSISAVSAAGVKNIAVSRFIMEAPEDLSYLQKGIQNLLVSRLTLPGKSVAVAVDKVVELPVSLGSELPAPVASRLMSGFGSDYLLVGAITAIGKSVSIDGWLYDLTNGGMPQKFTAQGLNLNDVIPQVNNMASSITSAVSGSFVSTTSTPQVEMPPPQVVPGSGPEHVVSALDVLINPLMQGQNISYLNPNFIEITPEEALKNIGVWRSQSIKEAIIGMDIGDLDGDGSQEVVTVSHDRVTVFRRQGAGLKVLGTYEASKMSRFVWCALVDLNNDRRDEIVITNMEKKNVTVGGIEDSMSKAITEYSIPASLILRWDGRKFQKLVDGIQYFLNVVSFAGEKVLVGQMKNTSGGFDSSIFEMRLQNNELKAIREIHVPTKYCNVFNFTVVDIDSDGSNEYVVILNDNKLVILGSNGRPMWKSRQRFGATTNFILGKATDLRYNMQDYYYIPAPIIVTDLNNDGIKEIVANRSPDYSKFLPQGFKYYESGQVVSLSWDQVGLIENWSTRELGGMVTSLRIADTDGNGVPELVVPVVLGKDLVSLWQTETVVFAYDLNLKKKQDIAR